MSTEKTNVFARYGSTKVGDVVDEVGNALVDSESTNVEWLESHLRALHPRAWNEARWGLTKNLVLGNDDDGGVVNSELTTVNWLERHLRAFLSELPCPNGDRAMMREPTFRTLLKKLRKVQKARPRRRLRAFVNIHRLVGLNLGVCCKLAAIVRLYLLSLYIRWPHVIMGQGELDPGQLFFTA